jgi:hypothetical protein
LDVDRVLEPGVVQDMVPDVVLVLGKDVDTEPDVVLGMEPDEASGVALGVARYNVGGMHPSRYLEGKSVLGVGAEPAQDEVLGTAEFHAGGDRCRRC